MISQFSQSTKSWKVLAIAALVSTSFYSCKESKDSVASSGKATVKVNLLGVATPEVVNGKKASVAATTSGVVHSEAIAFTKTSAFDVVLTNKTSSGIHGLRASSGAKAESVSERTPLAENVKYKVIVFDNNGNYVTDKTYTNSVDNGIGIELEVGQAYTFVAYSINSTSEVPAVAGQTTLANASLQNISSDLMYFSSNQTMQAGENTLNVVLKHQYSEITTNLGMDENMTGAITSLVNPFINPSHTSANLKLSDGTITYNGLSTTGVNVAFPTLGAAGLRTVSSAPTILIHPNETAGVLKFGSITIDGETKNNVSVSGLQIIPGQRYNLNLNFRTCTQNVVGGSDMNWSYPQMSQGGVGGANVNGTFYPNGSIVETNFTAPGADYGFVFDILRLDNSFNMEVNGVTLATKEIQFQTQTSTGQTIKFADGSVYGGTNVDGGSVPQIYSMTGTATNPIIKVVISRSGEVTLFGSKSSGGELFPLMLTNGNAFNHFPWSNSAVNNVKVTQEIAGTTNITGAGSGKKKVPCSL